MYHICAPLGPLLLPSGMKTGYKQTRRSRTPVAAASAEATAKEEEEDEETAVKAGSFSRREGPPPTVGNTLPLGGPAPKKSLGSGRRSNEHGS